MMLSLPGMVILQLFVLKNIFKKINSRKKFVSKLKMLFRSVADLASFIVLFTLWLAVLFYGLRPVVIGWMRGIQEYSGSCRLYFKPSANTRKNRYSIYKIYFTDKFGNQQGLDITRQDYEKHLTAETLSHDPEKYEPPVWHDCERPAHFLYLPRASAF
ncbi:MAG: hypothetical protein ACOZAN_01825 [Patescibacteria group bacterium]